MKLILTFLVTLILNQSLHAEGGVGEDPNLARSTSSEAGSTFTSAVSKGDQPAFCEKCEERTGVLLSNTKGTLTTASSVPSGSGTPSKQVKTGK